MILSYIGMIFSGIIPAAERSAPHATRRRILNAGCLNDEFSVWICPRVCCATADRSYGPPSRLNLPRKSASASGRTYVGCPRRRCPALSPVRGRHVGIISSSLEHLYHYSRLIGEGTIRAEVWGSDGLGVDTVAAALTVEIFARMKLGLSRGTAMWEPMTHMCGTYVCTGDLIRARR